MNFTNVKNLLYLNLIYTIAPPALDKLRKKQKGKYVDIRGAILRQHFFLAITYILIFGIGALRMHGDQGRFLSFVSVFSIFTVLQAILSIFNIFYESNDIQSCIPLPFSDLDIFIAKITSVLISIAYFVAPIILYCFLIQFNFKHPIYQSIVLGILSVVILIVAIILTSVLITYFLTKLPAFKKHKKVSITVLSILIILGTILMVVMMNSYDVAIKGNIPAIIRGNQAFWLFFGLAENPFSFRVLTHLLIWIAVIGIEAAICQKMIIPNIYSDATVMQNLISEGKKKKLKTYGSSLNSSLLHYHLGFLSDTQVLISYLLMPPLMFSIIVATQIFNFSVNLKNMVFTPNYVIVGIAIGGVYALLFSGLLSTIIISLDKENYNYIKSLPFDLLGYIRYKFYFSYLIQLIVPVICIIVLEVLAELPWYMNIAIILTYAIVAIPRSIKGIRKDHENLLLDWTNVLQLSQRGGAKVEMIGKFALVSFFGLLGIALSVILAKNSQFTTVVIVSIIVYCVILAWILYSIKKARDYFQKNY